MEVFEKQIAEFKKIDEELKKKGTYSGEKLFACILGLNNTESRILGYMLKNKDVRTSEIADVFEMDRSSIQRAVQDLSQLKLIHRKSMSMKDYSNVKGLDKGKTKGYLYVYNAKNIETIKIQLKKLLKKWYNSMLKYIDNLENLCECCGFKFEPC